MLILATDASTQAATAAVLCDGQIVCEYTQNQKKTHSVKLLPMIEQMLSDVDLTLQNIDVFACGIGPGSFTGLRIGVATVRAFAKTQEKPAVAVNTLEALAYNASWYGGSVCAMVFARENECYYAVYQHGQCITAPNVDTVENILKQVPDNTVFVGDGAVHHASMVGTERVLGTKHSLVSAASMAYVAETKVLRGETVSAEGLVPLYLRKCQAEREYDEREKKKMELEIK